MRQLELSLFDFRLHQTPVEDVTDLRAVLEAVRRETTVVPVASENRFENSLRISSREAMRRGITATSGPRCWQRTRSPASRKRG